MSLPLKKGCALHSVLGPAEIVKFVVTLHLVSPPCPYFQGWFVFYSGYHSVQETLKKKYRCDKVSTKVGDWVGLIVINFESFCLLSQWTVAFIVAWPFSTCSGEQRHDACSLMARIIKLTYKHNYRYICKLFFPLQHWNISTRLPSMVTVSQSLRIQWQGKNR